MRKLLIVAALFLLGLVAVGNAFARGPRPGPGPAWDRHGHAWNHGYGHRRVGVGVVVGAPFWMPWYYPPPYYPPVIIERQPPPVYIEQSPPVERETQTGYGGYWYYCQSPSGYYPEIRECPSAWIKVPPRP